jgi:hypothetical protein
MEANFSAPKIDEQKLSEIMLKANLHLDRRAETKTIIELN